MMFWVSMRVSERFIGAAIVNRPTTAEAVQAAGALAEPHLCEEHGREIEMAIAEIPAGSPPFPARSVERFLTSEDLETLWPGQLLSMKYENGRFLETNER